MSTTVNSTILDRVSSLALNGGFGEDTLAVVSNFVAACSCYTKINFGYIFQGTSGGGKSTAMQFVKNCLPPEDTIEISCLTEKALYRMDLNRKALFVDEISGAKTASHAIRHGLTHSTLNSVSSHNAENCDTQATVSQFSITMGTTSDSIHEELENRIIIGKLSNTLARRQEKARYQLLLASGKGKVDITTELNELHDLIRGLKYESAVVPFSQQLKFPMIQDDSNRRLEISMTVIRIVAILNQANRQIVDGEVLAQIEDYREAFPIIEMLYANSSDNDFNANEECVLGLFSDDNTLKFKEILSQSGMSYGTVHRTIQDLMDRHILVTDSNARGKVEKNYSLAPNADYTLIHPDVLIPESLVAEQVIQSSTTEEVALDIDIETSVVEEESYSTSTIETDVEVLTTNIEDESDEDEITITVYPSKMEKAVIVEDDIDVETLTSKAELLILNARCQPRDIMGKIKIGKYFDSNPKICFIGSQDEFNKSSEVLKNWKAPTIMFSRIDVVLGEAKETIFLNDLDLLKAIESSSISTYQDLYEVVKNNVKGPKISFGIPNVYGYIDYNEKSKILSTIGALAE